MKPTICPYKLQPIGPDDLSLEHVIPDALGGPETFSVDADKWSNSNLGSTLDGDFIDDDLIRAAATNYKIKTRSGFAKLKIQGHLSYEQNKIDAAMELGGDEPPRLHPKVPVVRTAEGFEILADHSHFDRRVAATIKNNAAKGTILEMTPPRTPAAEFRGQMTHSPWIKTLGLIKIGYLALAYTFGDQFVLSNAGHAFRKGFGSTSPTDLDNSGLDNPELLLTRLTLNPRPHHRVAAVRDGNAYGVYVSLFFEKAFTRQFSFPAGVQNFQQAQGEIYDVDAKRKKLTQQPFDPLRHL